MKRNIITCDVNGCAKDGLYEVDCCWGWEIKDGNIHYKKFEKPINPSRTDLCSEHFQEWSKLTCKLLKMDRIKE